MAQRTAMHNLSVTALLLIIAGGVIETNAIKLNITTLCADTQIYFCTISHINSSFQDPLVILNSSQPQLSELVFRNSQFGRMPSEIFPLTPQLRTIILHNCGVNRLNANDFAQAQKLRKLMLQKNRLFDLSAKIFSTMSILEELHLSGNTIHLLHRLTFSGLDKMKYLDMQQNAIETLPTGVFAELTSLEHIDLSHNNIEKIDAETFATNKQLQTVLLSDNQFTVFQSNSFEHLSHLRLLDVNNNFINELSLQSVDTLLAQNAMLERLIINGSVIKIHAGNNKLNGISVGEKLSVREAELHGNVFESMEDFVGMLNLQRLDISRNQLKSLRTSHSPLYLPLPNLVTLNLSSNLLQNLSTENFIIMQKITHLDLALNRLGRLDLRVFEPLFNLEKFYIEGNHLKYFNHEAFLQAHNYLKEFGIFDNDWNRIDLETMIKYFQNHAIQLPVRFQYYPGALNAHASATTISDMSTLPTKVPHHKHVTNEKVDVSGIHPYFTLRDVLALSILVGVAIVILLQFYMILKEEGCLPLRCNCFRRYNQNRQGRAQRLDEDDSEV